MLGRKSSDVFFFSIDSEKMNAAKIAAGSVPQRARCISGSTLPRILRTRTCGRQGEKFIESRPPKAFPVNRCARGRLFKRIFTKAVSPSELCLDEPRSCYLSLSLSASPLHESLKVHREAGNRRCLLLFRRGSRCRQLEARVRKVDESLL